MSQPQQHTTHLIITGKVQGVFYRVSAKDVAGKLGITGWVRNTKEGHVEITASGNKENMDAFIAWCRQGPSGAMVQKVIVEECAWSEFRNFTIHR